MSPSGRASVGPLGATESPSTIMGMPVFHNNRIYVTGGGDIWWGKRKAWLKCIDATQAGDVTDSGLVWSYPIAHHCCSTPSIRDGLAYVADQNGFLQVVDMTAPSTAATMIPPVTTSWTQLSSPHRG